MAPSVFRSATLQSRFKNFYVKKCLLAYVFDLTLQLHKEKTQIMGKFGVTEIVLILAVVLLLFGGKKIPELMRGIGKGVKSFKDGIKEEDPDSKSDTNTNTTK